MKNLNNDVNRPEDTNMFTVRIFSNPLPVAVHCGYLLFLLWAELAASMVLPTDTPEALRRSIIEDLQEALQVFSSSLSETVRRSHTKLTKRLFLQTCFRATAAVNSVQWRPCWISAF